MTQERKEFLASQLQAMKRETQARIDERRRELKAFNIDRKSPRFDRDDASDLGSDDLEFALVSMDEERLQKVEEALGRLENGTYGYCFECGSEIYERRLRALPFAVRCHECESAREVALNRERALALRRNSGSLFLNMG